MTPEELRSLADEATQRPQDDMEMARYYAAQKALIALAPDLARLCAELGDALKPFAELDYWPQGGYTIFHNDLDRANDVLAKLSELKP